MGSITVILVLVVGALSARAEGRPFDQPEKLGSPLAPLRLEPGRIDSSKVVLADAEHLAEKERTRSRDDFEACKAVVAKSVGYSASLLSGDGKPIQEAGYKSFMLEGRGKDLFFCEVFPRGRYRIKAALNGDLSFKYLAEGQF